MVPAPSKLPQQLRQLGQQVQLLETRLFIYRVPDFKDFVSGSGLSSGKTHMSKHSRTLTTRPRDSLNLVPLVNGRIPRFVTHFEPSSVGSMQVTVVRPVFVSRSLITGSMAAHAVTLQEQGTFGTHFEPSIPEASWDNELMNIGRSDLRQSRACRFGAYSWHTLSLIQLLYPVIALLLVFDLLASSSTRLIRSWNLFQEVTPETRSEKREDCCKTACFDIHVADFTSRRIDHLVC